MVHGWGMNADVFNDLADRLSADFDVRVFNLPGHGGRRAVSNNTLRGWADDIVSELPPGSTLLGWSLGGQLAMRAALDHPDRVSRLVLLSTTPRFVISNAWAHGLALADLQAFGADLLGNPRATLLRFMSLQTRGAADQRSLLHRLREVFQAAPDTDAGALQAGLAMLCATDLRAEVPALMQPALVLHGGLDTLTPAAAGRWLAAHLPHAAHVEYARAAHAPHLSHGDEVAADIRRFLHD
ncbi:MAG: alpha/beta fold hydrolase [Thiobacillus sp.]|nr:alpha/beta fold hydrolase [Thiobacillus sp.]